MAELHVQRKRKNLWWMWIIVILIIAAVIWYFYCYGHDSEPLASAVPLIVSQLFYV